ncbi:MAG: carbohydrate kinase family protein, partial [Anaerolineales bacterium]
SEAERLTGQSDPTRAAQALRGLGPAMVVVKRGSRGCLVCTMDGVLDQPAIAVPVVDTTGAGDSLDAAVVYGYLAGLEVRSLAVLANAAGAAKVQKRGTGRSVPTLSEIRAELKRAGSDPQIVLPDRER